MEKHFNETKKNVGYTQAQTERERNKKKHRVNICIYVFTQLCTVHR